MEPDVLDSESSDNLHTALRHAHSNVFNKYVYFCTTKYVWHTVSCLTIKLANNTLSFSWRLNSLIAPAGTIVGIVAVLRFNLPSNPLQHWPNFTRPSSDKWRSQTNSCWMVCRQGSRRCGQNGRSYQFSPRYICPASRCRLIESGCVFGLKWRNGFGSRNLTRIRLST